MTEPGVAAVERMYERWNNEGVDAVEECFTPDAEWHTLPELPDSAIYRGRDAVMDMLRALVSDMGQFRTEIGEVIAHEDVVVTGLRLTGVSRRGVSFEIAVTHVHELRNGLVASVRAFFEWEQALPAAGLSP